MGKLFARFNIHITKPTTAEDISKLQAALYDAALWAAADDPEVFFLEDKNVLGVSVEVEEDRLSMLEAGSILGQCQLTYERSDLAIGPTWLSLHDSDGEVIETSYEP